MAFCVRCFKGNCECEELFTFQNSSLSPEQKDKIIRILDRLRNAVAGIKIGGKITFEDLQEIEEAVRDVDKLKHSLKDQVELKVSICPA